MTTEDKSTLEKMIETSISLIEINFQSAVNNADKIPSSYYSEKSEKKDRRAEIFLTPNIVIMRQPDGKYFVTATANMRDGMVRISSEEFNVNEPKKRGRPFKTLIQA